MPLPSASPELNPAENIWQFLRNNYLSAQVFNTYTDILDSVEDAWHKLIEELGRIASITAREWAVIDQRL